VLDSCNNLKLQSIVVDWQNEAKFPCLFNPTCAEILLGSNGANPFAQHSNVLAAVTTPSSCSMSMAGSQAATAASACPTPPSSVPARAVHAAIE
jgi:hypothetical protein